MIKLLSIPVFLFLFSWQKISVSSEKDEISIKMIANNCSGCHLKNNHSDLIPSFYELEKEAFIKKNDKFSKN